MSRFQSKTEYLDHLESELRYAVGIEKAYRTRLEISQHLDASQADFEESGLPSDRAELAAIGGLGNPNRIISEIFQRGGDPTYRLWVIGIYVAMVTTAFIICCDFVDSQLENASSSVVLTLMFIVLQGSFILGAACRKIVSPSLAAIPLAVILSVQVYRSPQYVSGYKRTAVVEAIKNQVSSEPKWRRIEDQAIQDLQASLAKTYQVGQKIEIPVIVTESDRNFWKPGLLGTDDFSLHTPYPTIRTLDIQYRSQKSFSIEVQEIMSEVRNDRELRYYNLLALKKAADESPFLQLLSVVPMLLATYSLVFIPLIVLGSYCGKELIRRAWFKRSRVLRA